MGATNRLGMVGIAVVFLLILSLILSAFFCAFPWSMTLSRAATLGAPDDEPKAQLLLPGENWERNVITHTGDRWLALRNDASGSSLSRATVVVSRKQRAEIRPLVVAAKEGFSPLFFIRGIPGLSPGPVRALFDGRMPLGFDHAATFLDAGPGGSEISLTAVRPRADGPPERLKNLGLKVRFKKGYHLVLGSYLKGFRQYLMVLEDSPVRTPSLRWAGDLDRDGRVDPLLDVGTEETGGRIYQLWLSSMAKQGDLVGLAATLRDPDC